MTKETAKKTSFPIKAAGIVLLVLLVIYLGTAVYFHSRFLPFTSINGVKVSGKTTEAAEQLLKEEIDRYELSIEERDGKKEKISGADISLKPEFNHSVAEQLKKQNGFAWIVSVFTKPQLEIKTAAVYDEKALEKEIAALSCMKPFNQINPQDAHLSEYSDKGYKIIPEEQGKALDRQKFLNAVQSSIGELNETLSLEEADCYKKPSITADSKELIKLCDTMNQYVGAEITYEAGEKKERLDGNEIHKWITAADGEVIIDEAAAEEYVTSIASAFNTAFRKHTLKTSSGAVVDITTGDYGWKVDKAKEKEQLLAEIRAGEKVTREPVYAQRAASHGENDYGDTYVEINLTAQHLYFYKNGSLIVDSDFVSGNLMKNYDTPAGVYGLTYKERDATLNGENYSTPVSYWMPYCNNIGMHDASWRSSFGGSIYKTSGSHGCVNLPPAAAKKIFENIEEGDPVLVYHLEGSESAAAIAQDAAHVVNLINSVGEVTLESEPVIAMARKLYNMLPARGQAQVANYDLLCACEAQLGALKAQAAAPQ